MNLSIANISAQQLRRAASVRDRIDALQRELNRLLGTTAGNGAAAPGKRKLSRAAIARIRAGAKARWAKAKGRAGGAKGARKPKRRMSAAGRARLSALARARWKQAKAQGKATL
ncbi:MAG: hypothetical protein DME25_11555 [Verrucomicrobia bacterium]|nr:MAG: hypothetical protein DME25_11555 [Verrucomicrobiota bacterium]